MCDQKSLKHHNIGILLYCAMLPTLHDLPDHITDDKNMAPPPTCKTYIHLISLIMRQHLSTDPPVSTQFK